MPLHAAENLAQSIVRGRPQYDVHVIWHDDPRVQSVSLAGEEVQSRNGEGGNFRPTQSAVAGAFVEKLFYFAKIIALDIFEGNRLAGFIHNRFLFRCCMKLAQPASPFALYLEEHLFRQRLSQAKRNEVRCSLSFDMGKI